MANYNKSFNFTNGLQVDTSKFVVNQAGLVGVGTTVPDAYLDVYGTSELRGDVTVSGITSSTQAYVTGITTVGFATASDVWVSGAVTATKFYGDGSSLSGVFAVSASGWSFETGSPGVAYTDNKVGIGTSSPDTFFQVGSSSVNSNAEIRLGKRVTATETSLPAIAQVTSNGTDNSLGLSARTGVGNIIFYTGSGDWGGGSNRERLRVGSDGNVGIGSSAPIDRVDIEGTTRTTNLNVTGVSTFNGDVKLVGATSGRDVLWDTSDNALEFADDTKAKFGASDDLQIYTQSGGASCIHKSNTDLLISNNTFVSGDYQIRIQARNGENSILCHPDEYVRLFYDNTPRLETTGSGVDITDTLNVAGVSTFVGVGTFLGDLSIGNNLNVAGVSTLNDTLQVFKSSSAIVAVGKSASITGFNGQLRFGHTAGSFKYSDGESLDIINYSAGSFNFISNPNLIGSGKDFQWLFGENVDPKMTLTSGGRLGIGITLPEYALHVVGVSTFGGNSTISGNLIVKDDLTISTGDLTITSGSFVGNVKGNVLSSDGTTILNTGSASGTGAVVTGNVYTTTGISTFGGVYAVGISTIDNLLGIATDNPRSVADFDAGGVLGVQNNRYIIPPCLTNTQRGSLKNAVSAGATVTGAIIYNTNSNKLQVYTGSAWETITSS